MAKLLSNGKYSDGKVQCLICGKWYYHPMSHVWQVHKVLSREYKQEFGLEISKGLVAKVVHDIISENIRSHPDIIKNLTKMASKTGFKKGDQWKGNYKRSAQTIEKLRLIHLKRKKVLKKCRKCGQEKLMYKWRVWCTDCMPEVIKDCTKTEPYRNYNRQWYKDRSKDPSFVAHRMETHAEWVKNNRERLRQTTHKWLYSKNCSDCKTPITRYSKTGKCIHCFNKSK